MLQGVPGAPGETAGGLGSRQALSTLPRQRVNVQLNKGEHGFDNKAMDMKTIFRAVGPSFKRGLEVEPFESVHVYELMCKLLGIVPEANDGDLNILLPTLTSETNEHLSTPLPTSHSGEAPPSAWAQFGAFSARPWLWAHLRPLMFPGHLTLYSVLCASRQCRRNSMFKTGLLRARGEGGLPRAQAFAGEVPLLAPGPMEPLLPHGHMRNSFLESASVSLPQPHPTPTLTCLRGKGHLKADRVADHSRGLAGGRQALLSMSCEGPCRMRARTPVQLGHVNKEGW